LSWTSLFLNLDLANVELKVEYCKQADSAMAVTRAAAMNITDPGFACASALGRLPNAGSAGSTAVLNGSWDARTLTAHKSLRRVIKAAMSIATELVLSRVG
jgi:hypothetical protein